MIPGLWRRARSGRYWGARRACFPATALDERSSRRGSHSYDDTDICRVRQFEHDDTFHRAVLTEDDNNLRAWSARVGAARLRQGHWLLDEDRQRSRLDQNAPESEELIAGCVRQVITDSQKT